MDIINNKNYFVMKNCEFQMTGSKPVVMKGTAILEQPKTNYALDKRMHCVSFDNDMSFAAYIQYYQFIAEMVYTMDQHVKSPIFSLLDSGYIPVSIPPTFMAERIYNMILQVVKSLGLTYIEYPAYTMNGSRVDIEYPDVWVSKLELSQKFNIPVKEVTLKTIIERMGDV